MLWLGTLLAVRYVGKEVFFRFSYHRGMWHSLLALAVLRLRDRLDLQHSCWRGTQAVAWLAAGFMGVGFLTHLILDELYSVDVMDTRIKASFGTALKLFDYKHLGHSTAMAAATALVFYFTPPTRIFRVPQPLPAWSSHQRRRIGVAALACATGSRGRIYWNPARANEGHAGLLQRRPSHPQFGRPHALGAGRRISAAPSTGPACVAARGARLHAPLEFQ